MSLTVSTSIPRTRSIGGGAPLLSVKVGGLSPLPLKVGGGLSARGITLYVIYIR